MKIHCRGTARIRHRPSGKIYEIESDALDWQAVGSDERQMGEETHHEALIEHPVLGELKWGLWEYPTGVQNDLGTEVGSNELVEDFEYGLEHDEPDGHLWVDFITPGNPYGVFMDSYYETGDMLPDQGEDRGDRLINRLMFSHQVTALETYLGDTLINHVMRDADAMQRVLDRDDEVSKQKFTLTEVRKEPGLVERKVREYLRGVLYHNLAKVDVLYGIAFEFRILKLTSKQDELFKAVMLRHDCVHRNGLDKNGNKLKPFTREFVSETADLIQAFVESIEREVRQRSSS
ncbi:MAG: hypothetical protein JNL14_14675 [Devosia sp.]|nr:hypothetical protein [Devosia sp.]